ncbi:MFS transporter [Falsirhodobacter deserti]|uniref:MFS transporter n=1 Tax=Falsirhodobacter deserti TaxID=1365611 RepID=UPI0019D44746|nr:MFS transporter [Falsirhodobacter deserti]
MHRPPFRMLLPVTVVLAGLALRPTLAAIGPLLDVIQKQTHLSDIAAGLLTTLPVALMGLCMFATGWLRRLLGERHGIAIGIALVAVSSLGRWIGPDMFTLLATAVLSGFGIALVQALMPRVIRRRAATDAASLMGFYSTAIMAGALLASAASPWVAQVAGWPAALGIWAVPAALAGILWWWTLSEDPVAARNAAPLKLHRKLRAWLLMALFGLGTGAYTLVLAWLPPFYLSLGWRAEAAGGILAAVTLAEVAAGISVSVWIGCFVDRRPALLAATGALIVGLICFGTAPLLLAWPAAVLTGLGIGALFPLSLIVAMDHGRTPDEAGSIVSFVQGGGYILAALLPLVAGITRQHLADLSYVWWFMAALCLALGFIAICMRPGSRLGSAAEGETTDFCCESRHLGR